MDAYEATRIVLSRIQTLDPENASKIMGLLLIQDHGEKEMIRLAFGPEALLHSVVLKARKDLGLLPPSTPSTPSSPSPSPFLLARQNSASRLLGGGGGGGGSGLPSPSSWAPPPVFSRSSSSSNGNGGSGINGVVDDLQGGDELISSNSSYGVSMPPSSSSCSSPSPFFGGDLIEEFQLHDQLSFLNDPTAAASSPNSIHALQIPKGNGDLFYPDMAGDCRSPSSNGEGMLFPYAGMNWGMNSHHRRSYSAADRCLSSEVGADFGWRPCLYFARGYCKNGSSCRFLHGLPDDAAAAAAASMTGSKMDAVMEQQFHELLLRSKSQRLGSASQLMATAASFPYSPTAASPSSGKCMNFLLQPQQQQQNESQRVAAATAAAAALSLGGEEPHKFGRSRLERGDYAGTVNPGSRQIYLTFPADSTFREEDVANYFSIYGPVQDVRIPYQQKRMFGFVTFVYPETVKLILAKGNPHFVCDARVLVKPYKEKGKVPDKKQQQQADRGVFSGCSTPTGLDSKDPYDLQLLGASMLYNSSQEVLLRKKLEEQQQAELQQAIELQRRRFMGLQLLDLKTRNLSSPAVPVTSSLPSPSPINPYTTTTTTTTTTVASPNAAPSVPAEGSAEDLPPPEATTVVAQAGAAGAATAAAAAAAAAEKLNAHAFLQQQPVNAAAGADKEDSARDGSPKDDGDFQESAEHNLPDSPFASPTKCSFAGDAFSVASEVEATPISGSPNNNSDGCVNNSSNNSNHLISSSLLPAPSTLEMASFNSCFFPIARFSSGHGAVGM